MTGRPIRILLLLTVATILALAIAMAAGYHFFQAPGPLSGERTVVLPRGAGVAAIAEVLESEGIIADARLFNAGVRLYRAARRLRAGEYAFAAGISMRGVMDLLLSGRTVVRRLTVAEGLTTGEALAVVQAAQGLTGAVGEAPGEGALLPETYHYSYGDERAGLVRRMQDALNKVLAEAWAGRAPDLPIASPEEAVILASIVEKETGIAEERAHIAGVFINRLRRGMRLQSDPTVAFALTIGAAPLNRALTTTDLRLDSPYNTYQVAGLPPGPICNPGRAAIEAVLQPLDTGDLYFVADGSGGHVFAETYAEHRRNVRNWRRLQRSAQ